MNNAQKQVKLPIVRHAPCAALGLTEAARASPSPDEFTGFNGARTSNYQEGVWVSCHMKTVREPVSKVFGPDVAVVCPLCACATTSAVGSRS